MCPYSYMYVYVDETHLSSTLFFSVQHKILYDEHLVVKHLV